jgi:hypothetical protein
MNRVTVKRNSPAQTQPHGVMRQLNQPVYTGVKPSGVSTGANPYPSIQPTLNRISGRY